MVKQIIEFKDHLKKFELNGDEKELFLDAVNLLPHTVYVRGEPKNVLFLTAINDNDLETAFETFQELTWKDVAKRLINETKRVSREYNEAHKKNKVDMIINYALKK